MKIHYTSTLQTPENISEFTGSTMTPIIKIYTPYIYYHSPTMNDLQLFLYRSGDAFLPKNIRKHYLDPPFLGNTNTYYINGWSILHFLSGILSGYIYLYLQFPIQEYYPRLLVLHTIWELWQVFIGMTSLFRWKGGDGLADTLIDTIFFMLGTTLPVLNRT